MAAKYVLDCLCGASVTVEASQAGGGVRCPACGETVDVPTLGKLRQLPLADPSPPTPSSRDWTVRHSLAAIAMITAVAATVVAIYMWSQKETDAGIRDQTELETQQIIDQLTPAGAWKYWQDFKSKVEAFGFDSVRSYARLQRQVTTARYARLQTIWLSVAGAGVLVALVAWWWPSSRPKPRG